MHDGGMKRRVLGSGEINYYHVMSRVVDRRMVFGAEEKQCFRRMMGRLLEFSGIRCVTFCLMGNHFHLLLAVPDEEGREFKATATVEAIFKRLAALYSREHLNEIKAEYREEQKQGEEAGQAYLQQFLNRMYDLSSFVKELKFGFSRWYNEREQRTGTLWEARYKSVLVEGRGEILRVMAAYIDLNPVRAGMVKDPKDYSWSGYGEAVAGGKRSREGLTIAVGGCSPDSEKASWTEIQTEYRLLLFGAGRFASGEGGKEKQRLDSEAVAAVLREGGHLSMAQVLRCRVRYFSDGFAIGTHGFLGGVFKEQRHHFSKGRKKGAVRMRWAEWGGMMAMRNLQKAAVMQPVEGDEML